MRHLLLLALLLTACTADDAPPVDPAANLCRDDLRADVRTQRCSERCKPADGSPGEVCAVDLELACLDECERCNPFEAWCPAP